ncbi:acylphosphatase [Bowmanella dokdonensis]|uniref:Acylphosphatase n=1 Tax=Bowmanella dokdonensis TaxID=751969 RepID=A0A939ILP2_9ALTE|nr:acylphosphatase [Bowmanella dokdonensis]MBN7824428.1 acylphosphatase [Bowmanella dokdonensis]
MAKQCIKARVTGKVQGVFFRKSTQARALQLGLSGYAKNLADGSVEVLACGKKSDLEELVAFLREGPPASDVSDVQVNPAAVTDTEGFDTL